MTGMKRIVSSLAGVLLVAAVVGAAAAAPVIPPSVTPGRERDRFTPSPVEKFFGPGPYAAPQIAAPDCGAPRRNSKPAAKRKNC
jgi:hypothetical protein